MEINYSITAKAEETVQGINVTLQGYVQKNANRRYMNVTINYNTKEQDFENINGSNIDTSFLTLVMPLITEFREEITQTHTFNQ